ncbi:hypothetical protein [Streptomyces sp. NPDC089799]|uniref:hypothetical protein n=1 Tax=Streptomyces sp. NPDC089799 TaxID=3155066 RepID=UPI00344883C0
MEKTWFEVVFRRKLHPVLRLLGNLAWGAFTVITTLVAITQSNIAWWWWFIVPADILMLMGVYRGVVVALRDLRRRSDAAEPGGTSRVG